jgi:hypothetical protein
LAHQKQTRACPFGETTKVVHVSPDSTLAYFWEARYAADSIVLDRQPPRESASGIPVRIRARCNDGTTIVETDWHSDGSIDDRMAFQATPGTPYVNMQIDTNADGTIDQYISAVGKNGLVQAIMTTADGRELYRFTARHSADRRIGERWLDDLVHSERLYMKVIRNPTGSMSFRETRTQRSDGTTEVRRWMLDEHGALQSSAQLDADGPTQHLRCRFEPACAEKFEKCERLCAEQDATNQASK